MKLLNDSLNDSDTYIYFQLFCNTIKIKRKPNFFKTMS